jgi:hypothetical protein
MIVNNNINAVQNFEKASSLIYFDVYSAINNFLVCNLNNY